MNCILDTITSYDVSSGRLLLQSVYIYKGTKVDRVNLSDLASSGYEVYEYNGDFVSKISHYGIRAGIAQLTTYSKFLYNTDGTLSKGEFYSAGTSGAPDVLWSRQEFTYTGGKMTKMKVLIGMPGGGLDSVECIYTYTGSNISSLKFVGLNNNQPDVHYSSDTRPNFYKAQPLLRYTYEGFPFNPIYAAPRFFSENNIILIDGNPVAYKENSKKLMTESSDKYYERLAYKYKCQ
ncbi:MAG: hypothetical protein H7Y27_02790 [Gemmatimonadaceae bacterium]|nr:hypothetical protein [Chitinophagaceae bacterium]